MLGAIENATDKFPMAPILKAIEPLANLGKKIPKEPTTLEQLRQYGAWLDAKPTVTDFSDMESLGADVFGIGDCVIVEFLEDEKFMVSVQRVSDRKKFEVSPELVQEIYEVCKECDKSECECKIEEQENEFNSPSLSDFERNNGANYHN